MKFEKIKGNANHHMFWRGKRLWVRFFKADKGTLEKSLGTAELGLGRIRRDEEIAKFLGVTPKWKGSTFLVEDKFPSYVELKKGKAPRTYRSIKDHWTLHLKPYFGNLRLDDVTESEWLKYVQQKRESAPRRKFFNDRKYLSMFLNWLHRDGYIKKIPRLENVDQARDAGKVFTDAEVYRLVANSTRDLRLQILMAVTMGMRKGEVLTLEWWQVETQRNSIYLPAEKTKIRKERTFGISEVCHKMLSQRPGWGSKEGFVFPGKRGRKGSVSPAGNQKAWKGCKTKAQVVGRFHDLRHTFLTKAFKKAVNPALICEYAGLSMEEAQKTYLHFSIEDTRVVADLVQF